MACPPPTPGMDNDPRGIIYFVITLLVVAALGIGCACYFSIRYNEAAAWQDYVPNPRVQLCSDAAEQAIASTVTTNLPVPDVRGEIVAIQQREQACIEAIIQPDVTSAGNPP